MKKTMLYLLLSILAVTVLFGATAVFAKDSIKRDAEMQIVSSDLYEVVHFSKPYKTSYSLSEIKATEYTDEDGKTRTSYSIDFDGTGMYMTVKHNGTGRVKNYTYKCNYFELDGETIKYENPLQFYNYSDEEFDISVGEHTIGVMLTTDEGDTVIQDFTYKIIDDKKSDEKTPFTETQTPTEQEYELDKNLTLPDVKGLWEHNINQKNCKLEIKEQDGNKLKLVITVANKRATQVAISRIDVTVDKLWKQGNSVYGEGDFIYIDTYNNAGIGTIRITENSITLNLDQQSNGNRGWDILRAIGNYSHSDKN